MGVQSFVNSNTGIVYLQQFTTAEILAIPFPKTGMLVYNTTLQCPCFYDSVNWHKISHSVM